jgi:type VI secretion system protein VasD
MNRPTMLTLTGLLALAGCGGPPPKPPPVLTMTIIGSADQNPDAEGKPSPVAVRVYQLSATAKFEQADVFALKDAEAKTLGTEAATGSQEFLISPGETKKLTIDLKPMVSAIGVAVMYRNIDSAKWRADQPANANGPTIMAVATGKLQVVLKSEAPGSTGIIAGVGQKLGINTDDLVQKAQDTASDAAKDAAKNAATNVLEKKPVFGQ